MGEFFVILLIVVGYFLFFSWILSHSDKRWSVSAMLFVALLVYGSVVCMCIAIGQYLGEMGLMLYGVAIVYSCLYGCWKIYTIFRERLKIKLSVLLMLIAYVVAVFYITIFMREEGSNNHVQMEVMHWAYSDDRGAFQHVAQNIAMFVPVGFLCALLPREDCQKRLVPGASFGLLLSVLIETSQLIFQFGSCDIDDILANFIGAAFGAGAVFIWEKRSMQKAKTNGAGKWTEDEQW